MTNSEFIKTIAPIIVKYAKQCGYKYPSAIIAQACNESGYGRSSLGCKYHNYFGMKCGSSWTGKSINLSTKEEYTVGTLTEIRDNFRVYDDMDTGVRGYFEFISKPRYSNLKEATSPKHYLELIKADGYATSSKYVDNVYAVVVKQNLTIYDVELPTDCKSVDEVVKEVINGKWGNGSERKKKLTEAGYDYTVVQSKVNELLALKPTEPSHNKKPNGEIAKEVIRGLWGNGCERKRRLEQAGYDYYSIQKIVNEMCR